MRKRWQELIIIDSEFTTCLTVHQSLVVTKIILLQKKVEQEPKKQIMQELQQMDLVQILELESELVEIIMVVEMKNSCLVDRKDR